MLVGSPFGHSGSAEPRGSQVRRAAARGRWRGARRRRGPTASASGEARAEREGGSRTEMSDLSPGRTGSRNTPTGWISGSSSFSTWCCSSSCTSCPDCFTETSRMWPLK